MLKKIIKKKMMSGTRLLVFESRYHCCVPLGKLLNFSGPQFPYM